MSVISAFATWRSFAYPAAINDRGQIAGSARTGDGSTHAVLWTQ